MYIFIITETFQKNKHKNVLNYKNNLYFVQITPFLNLSRNITEVDAT